MFPFKGTHLPSDLAHHIGCMLLLSLVLGLILICSMSRAHVHYHLSCGTFSMLSHAAMTFWPHAVRSLLRIHLCHLSRSRGPVLFQTQTPHRRRGCESYHRDCQSYHGLGLSFHGRHRELLSVSKRLSAGSLSLQQTVLWSLR